MKQTTIVNTFIFGHKEATETKTKKKATTYNEKFDGKAEKCRMVRARKRASERAMQ